MSNETTTAKPPAAAVALGILLALAGLSLIVVFAGPYFVDFIMNTWLAVNNSAAWVFGHTLVPVWDALADLLG
jgi:hypothetical protein